MALPWCPTFVVGAQTFTFRYPVRRWIPGERTTGFRAKDATGVPTAEVRLHRHILGLVLRLVDDEWGDVKTFLAAVQTGRQFTWEPNADMTVPDMPESFDVYLESPRVTEPIHPARDAQYPNVLTLPIVIASHESPFHAYYFPTDT